MAFTSVKYFGEYIFRVQFSVSLDSSLMYFHKCFFLSVLVILYCLTQCCGRGLVISLSCLLAVCAADSWLLLQSCRETGPLYNDQGRNCDHFYKIPTTHLASCCSHRTQDTVFSLIGTGSVDGLHSNVTHFVFKGDLLSQSRLSIELILW